MCRSMVDIQSPTAEIRRGKKERRKKEEEEETEWKYNGLPYYIGRPWWYLYGMSSFHFYRRNQFKVILLVCTLRTRNQPQKFLRRWTRLHGMPRHNNNCLNGRGLITSLEEKWFMTQMGHDPVSVILLHHLSFPSPDVSNAEMTLATVLATI